ncbi:hypothetical protein M758_6G170400 [Ceratodon purpureus]|nr:hypothetical protein M758_6G170400 [Ceratodon purpureus]
MSQFLQQDPFFPPLLQVNRHSKTFWSVEQLESGVGCKVFSSLMCTFLKISNVAHSFTMGAFVYCLQLEFVQFLDGFFGFPFLLYLLVLELEFHFEDHERANRGTTWRKLNNTCQHTKRKLICLRSY